MTSGALHGDKMHELGVVFYVIKDLKEVAEENNVTRIESVTLQIGQVSGIIHEYLTDCWNWARKKEQLLEETKLLIEQIDAVTHCTGCGGNYETVKYAKVCPYCGSGDTYLLRGNEFLIKEIEVLDDYSTGSEDECVKQCSSSNLADDGDGENYFCEGAG